MSKSVGINVQLLSHTGGELIAALAAKLCYSDSNIKGLQDKLSEKDQGDFLQMISRMGHHSVFEHVSFTFGVEGVSRALTHQLVRHRMASYSQKSQRYVKLKGNIDYIVPPTIQDNPQAVQEYLRIMDEISESYARLAALGVPAEDARYVLPNGCETKIIVTMNARELLHFFRMRACARAQWEIRSLAVELLKLVFPVAPSIFKNAGPACVGGVCSEGKMTCGKPAEVREYFRNISKQ